MFTEEIDDDTPVPSMVHHPNHYTQYALNGKPIECIEVLEVMAKAGADFRVINAMKYLWRYRDKGGMQDVEKARWYLDRYISQHTPTCK